MAIWSAEIKEIKKLLDSFKGQFPDLEKEIKPLINSEDPNVILLYSRRCLEVIITELCEVELKRPRKTEPLKGIIDKLNSEDKVPANIISSMHGLNSLSTFGTHPKEFEPEQVKPVLNNLTTILKWYIRYVGSKSSKTLENKEELSESRKNLKGPQKKLSGNVIYVILIIVVIAFISTIYLVSRQNNNLKKIEKSIAVLPFRNDSPGEDSTQYFMNGVMEELLNNLQKIKELRVLGRTSVEQYRGQNKSIAQIGKELGANYIVEGSGQKSGNSFRMRVQLLLANNERHIWANSFEQEKLQLKQYFKIQTEFAEEIASELNAAITSGERNLIDKIPTEKLDAYEAYLQGMFYFRKMTRSDMETALKYFGLAKTIDPEYALANAGIGFVWLGMAQNGFAPPEEAGPKGIYALNVALELDSTIDQIHYMNAAMKTWTEWDWKGGESEFRKTFALNPNNSEARAVYSHYLNCMGRPGEAQEQIEMALKLDPISPFIKTFYSVDLIFFRKFDEALATANEVLKIEPNNPVAQPARAWVLLLKNNYNEGIKAVKTYYDNVYPGIIHAADKGTGSDNFKKWLQSEADTLSIQSKDIFILPFDISVLYTISGDYNQALNWLEKGYEVRDQNMPYMLWPLFDSIRYDPRFKVIAKKMNFPQI